MTAALDNAYQTERARLTNTVTAAAAGLLASLYQDRKETTARVIPLVEAGQAHTVALVDGYMTAKAAAAGAPARLKGLDAALYTTLILRRTPPSAVYSRPFGAFYGQLENGATVEQALASARGSMLRLVQTDLQLTQTHAARDWMADDDRVVGWERVLGAGKNCPLCVAASTRRYYREDLMPIHERCGCTVAPVYASDVELSRPFEAVRVADDDEIGPRLLDESWAAG